MASILNSISPLDWVSAATVAAHDALPAMYEKTGLAQTVLKADLRPGSHIYSWRKGYTFSHHGVVVHVEACSPSCNHVDLSCCAVVHFVPPHGSDKERICITSLAEFLHGGQPHEVRYRTTQAEYFLKRAGCCSTHEPAPWPLVVLRALGTIDFLPVGADSSSETRTENTDGTPNTSDTFAVEYNMLTKNCELLARWCKLGPVSGVRRFYSTESAYTPQSAPARFVRLGLAAAVPMAAVAAAAYVGAVPVVTGTQALAVGSLASSTAARAILLDSARNPQRAVKLAREGASLAGSLGNATLARGSLGSLVGAGARPEVDERRQEQDSRPWARVEEASRMLQQGESVCTALQACVKDLGVIFPKQLMTLGDEPWACCRLCEMLADALEQRSPSNCFECAAGMQAFLDDLATC